MPQPLSHCDHTAGRLITSAHESPHSTGYVPTAAHKHSNNNNGFNITVTCTRVLTTSKFFTLCLACVCHWLPLAKGLCSLSCPTFRIAAVCCSSWCRLRVFLLPSSLCRAQPKAVCAVTSPSPTDGCWGRARRGCDHCDKKTPQNTYTNAGYRKLLPNVWHVLQVAVLALSSPEMHAVSVRPVLACLGLSSPNRAGDVQSKSAPASPSS